MIENYYDLNKTGTLIVSQYRSGTHFLHDALLDTLGNTASGHGEICNDNTINQLQQLTTIPDYKICILNNVEPKFYLIAQHKLLSKWHVVHLTRNQKIHHFISYWFWLQNTLSEQKDNTGKFLHHNTSTEQYKQYIKQKHYFSIGKVIVWLQEQLISHHIPANIKIDYADLVTIGTKNIVWKPNKYDDITLADIFENHIEIQHFLENFKIESI